MVVVNGEIIAEIMADSDVMPAVQAEFLTLQTEDDPSKSFRILVKLFLLSGHWLPPK